MRDMEMIAVESEAIEAVGYDASTRELRVRFTGGETYAYSDVDELTFDDLMRAESKGAFVNRVIKPAHDVHHL